MPFSRYLQSNERDHHQPAPDDDIDNNTFSTNVHFQLPNLIFSAPTVPPGGGAEALPAGLYPPSSSLAWFTAQQHFHPHHSSYVPPHPRAAAPPSAPSHFPSSFPSSSSAPVPPYHPPPTPSSSASPQSATSPSFPLPLTHALSYPSHTPTHPFPQNLPLSIPSALGLPIYSASGFDLLSLLSRVATRPYPKISLGPVDLSCSFVVTDTRRFDAPIVYASPSFLKLTGYDEPEVIGRNCRFLQAPGGLVNKGDDRAHTSRDAVSLMRKSLIADKECQVSVINYRKDGSAFINMVSVIPLRGGVNNAPDEADDIVYHIGFQVDLTEQPKSILSKLKDGTYVVNYSDKPAMPIPAPTRDWRTSSMSMRGASKDLRTLLIDPTFVASFRLSTSTHASTALALSNSPAEPVSLDPYDGNKPLHMFLLDRSPDFLHVVSLKGAFLYVAPAVRHVLGYDPDELVGRSLTDFCHPADCVPLMRELKEASSTPVPSLPGASGVDSASTTATPNAAPRPVDLLFRIQAKGRGFVWVECRGRLHVEPGKGRKAIILSGRVRNMPHLRWGPISRAGGVVAPLPPQTTPLSASPLDAGEEEAAAAVGALDREFWGLLSANATFLYVGAAIRDVLGWGAGEVIGKRLADFVSGSSAQEVALAIDVEMAKVLAASGGSESSGLACDVHTKEGGTVPVHVVLYRSQPPADARGGAMGSTAAAGGGAAEGPARAPIVCQIKLCDGAAPPPTQPIVHPLEESVFDETELERDSSWQYELQQLKYRNQRLVQEVADLETSVTKKLRRKQTSAVLGAAAPPSSAPSVAGRRASRTSFSYQPAQSPVVKQQQQAPPPPPVAAPLAVRFVTDVQGMPPSQQQQQQQPPMHPSPPQPTPVSQLTSSAMLPSAHAQQHSRAPPPPHIQLPSSSMTIQQPIPQQHHHQHQHRRSDASMYPPPRMQHSTESALQGWSSYGYAAPPEGAPEVGAVPTPVSYKSLPAKRSWDASFRDSGGGDVGGQ